MLTKKLFVVDAVNYIARSYFAIKGMTNHKGESTNALYGFIRSLEKLRKDFQPEHLVCVFDGPDNKKSRLGIYPDYKGHRAGMPEDLFPQIAYTKEYCDAAGIAIVEVPGVEADDVMGSIAVWAAREGAEVYLCSSDKDLCQLVGDNIRILNQYKDNLIIDETKVQEIYGVRPDQIIDYLAIMGDASDNIPGIKGFGPKTAQELLQKFGNLKTILLHPEKVENKKREEKLIAERKNAEISQLLATIQLDVEFPQDDSFFLIQQPNRELLTALYNEMNFNTLLKELGAAPQKTEKGSYQIIDDEKSLQELLDRLSKSKEIVIDTETDILSPMEARIIGIGLTVEAGIGYYIPLNGKLGEKEVCRLVAPFLQNNSFIGHNIKYDMHVLANHGLALGRITFDTMIASYLLNSNSNRHNLDILALEKFGFIKTPIDTLLGAKKKGSMIDAPIDAVANYCGEDVDYTLRLKNFFEKELKKKEKLEKLFYEVEMPLLTVLYQMERHGMYVDVAYLRTLSQEFRRKLEHLEQEIYRLAKMEFNINSPKQLAEVLYTHLGLKKSGRQKQTAFATGKEVLETLQEEHPVIPLILEYRVLAKLLSTYVDALPLEVNQKTGRIHCTFNQSVTATGRLSATNPNLQNIPIRSKEGKKIREAFKPQKPGWSYICADYSQIELRILAHFSEEPVLIKAFKNNEDIHRTSAAEVFGVSLEDVTDEMRSSAKAVNFGLIYGQQAFGLSQGLKIDIHDAAHFIEMYFKKYPRVKEFIESSKRQAMKEGLAKSLLERERLLPDINSKNGIARAQAMRFAVNAPIQGTQSDIIKLAMIKINKEFLKREWKGFMTTQIHDELVFESPDNEVDECKKVISSIMEGVVELRVPLKVDISVGKNWGEC